jgi:hypothetical protein
MRGRVQVSGTLVGPGLPEGQAFTRAETGHKVSLPQRATAGRHGRQRQRCHQPVNGNRCVGLHNRPGSPRGHTLSSPDARHILTLDNIVIYGVHTVRIRCGAGAVLR